MRTSHHQRLAWSTPLALALALAALLPAAAALGAPPSRLVMPWMCLEDCGFSKAQIAAQLQQLATPGVFTDASYEDYDLSPEGLVTKFSARSRVSGDVAALGLGSHAMIVSWFTNSTRAALAAPEAFVASVVSLILDVERSNVTALNLDFEPNGAANPPGPEPTPADAVAYAAFLNVVADAMHARGVKVGVDIATWSPFWDYSLLNSTRVDWLFDMESYQAPQAGFEKAVLHAQQFLSADKYVCGLETHPFNSTELAQRFAFLRERNVGRVAVWSSPMPAEWLPYLAAVGT